MHSRLPKVGTAVGVVAGLVAGSLAMAPITTAAEEETVGNNLAIPLLWSESAFPITIPGTAGITSLTGVKEPCSEDTSVMAAVQKDAGNSWQADNMLVEGSSVSSLDWGDNIEVKDWSIGPPVRVETALYADLAETMTGYEMCHVSGKGTDEVWGARIATGGGGSMTVASNETLRKPSDGKGPGKKDDPVNEDPVAEEPGTEDPATDDPDMQEPDAEESMQEEPQVEEAAENGGSSLVEYESSEAMVYTAGARLTIQRIDADATPTWDAVQHRWVGKGVADPVFNGAVHEKTSDGPGSYGAEINVSGKVVFGFNWQTDGLFNGDYRITFSLDGATGTFPGSGTSLANAEIRQTVETTAGDELAIRSAAMAGPGGGMGGGGHGGGGGGGGGEGGGNTAVLVGAQNLSYIDVGLSGGEDPPVTPDPEPTSEPTTPPAPPSGGGGGGSAPSDGSSGAVAGGGATESTPAESGQPGAGVPVEVASPILAQQRIQQRARITAPKSSKQRVRTRLMLTEGPVFTDQGVTVRWRVTERSQDNCTLRNRSGQVSVKFTKAGRCTVIAWAPSPNPEVFAPFREKRVYQVRNSI